MFLVGDSHQRIYDRRTSLSKVGINIVNGTATGLSGTGPFTLSVTPAGQGAVTCQVTAGAAGTLAASATVAAVCDRR